MGTVMILSFLTYRSGQTVQTQLRLLLKEQSDQGLHCLLFHLHLFDKLPFVEILGKLQQIFLASENLGLTVHLGEFDIWINIISTCLICPINLY